MASSIVSVPLPSGWEQKLDANSGKYYYIDHVHKKTQWVDPRLTHPKVWNPARLEALAQLKESFANAPENTVRHSLLQYNFNTVEASKHLAGLGFHQGQRSQLQSSPTPQPTPASPDFSSARDPAIDEFDLLQVRSRFPNVTDQVIKDVLLSCQKNFDMCCEMLAGMGYEDRVKAEESARRELEEKRQRENERKLLKSRLNVEFSRVGDATLAMCLESAGYNYETAKSLLKVEQGLSLLQEELNTPRFANSRLSLNQNALRQLIERTDGDVDEARKVLHRQIEEKNKEVEKMRKEAAQKKTAQESRQSTSGTSRQNVPVQRVSKTPSPTKSRREVQASDSGNVSSSHPNILEPTMPRTKLQSEGFREGGAVGGVLGSVKKSLVAKGPNPELRKGHNPELLW